MIVFITNFAFFVAQEGNGDGGSGIGQYSTTIIMIVLFVGVFYFLLIRPGQKQRKQHQQLVESIKKGDEVMTAGGFFGTVKSVHDDHIMLELAKKNVVKLSRNSIARVTSADEELEEYEEEEYEEEEYEEEENDEEE